MAEPQIFAGIDVGSTAVRVAVGQRLSQPGDRDVLNVIGAAEVPTEGVNRGQIRSIDDAVTSISTCLEKVERMTGVSLRQVCVAIGGTHVTMQESHGVVAVSRADGEIREEDVARAVDAAQTLPVIQNAETIDVVPRVFTVDGATGFKDPVGMSGIRLEVDCQIIQANTQHMKNLARCVYRTGLNIERPVVGILASAAATVSARQKELGVAVVNIGSAASSLAVFEQGDLLRLATIPVGSEHLTSDIAIGLRTSIDVAERVKLQHAHAVPADCPKGEELNLRELGAVDDDVVSRRYVCEIAEARLEELMEMIDKELRKIDRSGLLPAGVVFTGGGAKLSGLTDLAKRKLRLPAVIGVPLGVRGITDRINDASFTTAIGLAQMWMNDTPPEPERGGLKMPGLGPVTRVKTTIMGWFTS